MKHVLWSGLILVLLSSCASRQQGQQDQPQTKTTEGRSYLVLPFEDQTSTRAAVSEFLRNLRYHLLNELRARRIGAFDYFKYEPVLSELEISEDKVSQEEGLHAAKILQADAVIFMRVTEGAPGSGSSGLQLNFYIRVRHATTQGMLLSITLTKGFRSLTQLESEALHFARRIVHTFETAGL